VSEDKDPLGPFIYVWLALSILINVSGIGSIVDGFVHWVGFFRDFLDIYRTLIHEPISWAAHLIWPSSWPKIPLWAFDVFVIWAGLFLAINIANFRAYGESYWTSAVRAEGVLKGTVWIVVFFLLGPVIYPTVAIFGHDEDREQRGEARQVLTYFILLIATVTVLAFLNWQVQHIPSGA
jgi:hypothetical protein